MGADRPWVAGFGGTIEEVPRGGSTTTDTDSRVTAGTATSMVAMCNRSATPHCGERRADGRDLHARAAARSSFRTQ